MRLGNVRTLIRHRCGHVLPEDDAGYEYLVEMLKIVSLGPDPELRMVNTVETFAPFMSRPDAERIIAHVNRMPVWKRWPKPKLLGENLRLTNVERERLGLWSIGPCDISVEDLAEQRKAKNEQGRRDTGRARSRLRAAPNTSQPIRSTAPSRGRRNTRPSAKPHGTDAKKDVRIIARLRVGSP